MRKQGTNAGTITVRFFAALGVAALMTCVPSPSAAADPAPTDPTAAAAAGASTAALTAATDWIEQCRASGGAENRYCVVCISVGGSNASTNVPPGFCLASDLNPNAGGAANFSVANEAPVTQLNYIQTPQANSTNPTASATGATDPIHCKSLGGSEVSPDAANGVCLAADLRLANGVPAAFAFGNGSAVRGLQFMQVSFRDKASNGTVAGATGPTACQPASGSKSLASNGGGFCMTSDLAASASGPTSFTVANDLPVAGVQFLQISLDESDAAASSSAPTGPIGAYCRSHAGTEAAAGESNGFCLAADLSSTNSILGNFSFANRAPIKDLQFVQMTFADPGGARLDQQFVGSGGSSAGNCVSTKGSAASTGTLSGFCLASDLISSQGASAGLTIANGLPVASMQFVQATFSKESPLADLTDRLGRTDDPSRADCFSARGTGSSVSNPSGFCIASDLGKPETGLADLALANDLPIAALQFLQIPLGAESSEEPSSGSPRPRGMSISDMQRKRSEPLYRPAVGSLSLKKPRFYGIDPRRRVMQAYLKSKRRLPRTLSVWVNRTIKSLVKNKVVK